MQVALPQGRFPQLQPSLSVPRIEKQKVNAVFFSQSKIPCVTTLPLFTGDVLYSLHLADGETEAWRNEVTDVRLPGLWLASGRARIQSRPLVPDHQPSWHPTP